MVEKKQKKKTLPPKETWMTFSTGPSVTPYESQCSIYEPGRVAPSVGHLTRKSGVLGSIPGWQHSFVSPPAFSRRAVVSYWRKYVHKELVNRLGGLRLSWKSVVRLTDHPDMTLDVYRGRKTTVQQQQQQSSRYEGMEKII